MAKIYKKQPLDIVVSGIPLRYSVKYNIRVNKEGTRAYREYNDPSWNRFLQIHTDINGSKFLNVKPKIVQLDEVVADCFKPMPNDGKKYELIHKDGNIGNCHAFNLEWKEVRKYFPTDTKRTLDNGLIVEVNGNIYDNGKKLHQQNSLYDGDMQREVAIEPKVRYRRKNRWRNYYDKSADVDDLMAAAEFVDGDRSTMQKPKVLHKNMNYLDFHADNLEWVEESSPEYQEYMKKKREDMDKLTKELNRNNPFFQKD